jgi:hypothetical protein
MAADDSVVAGGSTFFALILIAGLLSDIWDGVLARRWDAQRRGSALLTVRWTRCFILVWERR